MSINRKNIKSSVRSTVGVISILAMLAMLIVSCDNSSVEASLPDQDLDTIPALQKILDRGEIVALTAYSSTSYFIYKGRPMGYEYELMQGLAKHLGVKLKFIVVPNLDSIFDYLHDGKGDLIAYGITKTLQRQKEIDFSNYLNLTNQVLVQRKPVNWRDLPIHVTDSKLVRNVFHLIGKEVHVRKNSSYYKRLHNLCEELGDSIIIKTVDGEMKTDDLIRMVLEGEIDYTIADKNIAMANQLFYDNIDFKTKVSFPQQVAWVLPKGEPELLEVVNEYIDSIKANHSFHILFSKYFRKSIRQKAIANSSYNSNNANKLSDFDDQLKLASKVLNWDWRLLASVAYQESNFKPEITSWVGAVGFMQIMPHTASQYGNYNLLDVDQNLEVAEKHIKWIEGQFSGLDSINTIKFTLAAYNVGPGHIQDAVRLAEVFGLNPKVWDDNVAEMLLKKRLPEYYNHEVVRNGYCRGIETYNYVKEIFERFEDYKLHIE